jgi:DNA primase
MAGRFTDAWLEELRTRAPIEEVVGEYVRLKQKGKRFWGLCPFHNEKTPSFSVDSESQLYYCFGCHKGGTVFNFVMDVERMEFPDAVKHLAERAHMDLPEDSAPGPRLNAGTRERIFEANVAAAHFFHTLLWMNEGAQALKYLYGRGLNDQDIRSFGIGASPSGWDDLLRELEGKGFSREELQTAGLIGVRDGRAYDMFRSRVIFPIISPQGKVLGFGGRAMGDAGPKYLNTPDTPVFNKRNNLYALNFARAERQAGHLVLVEGYMDVVSLRKHGVQGVVATLGTALTQEQSLLMKRYAGEVWISYDGDAAGRKAALRALDILEAAGLATRVIDYPGGMDPDDFIKANGLAGFEGLGKIGGVEYRMIRAKDDLDLSTQDGMTRYALQACAIIRTVKNPVEAENYLRRLANETGYDRDILARQVGAVTPQREILAPKTRRDRDAVKASRAEGTLLALLAKGLIPPETIAAEDFDSAVSARAAQWLLEGNPISVFVVNLDEGERAQFMADINAEQLPDDPAVALDMARDMLSSIRERRRKEQIERLKEMLPTADGEQKKELLARISQLMREARS